MALRVNASTVRIISPRYRQRRCPIDTVSRLSVNLPVGRRPTVILMPFCRPAKAPAFFRLPSSPASSNDARSSDAARPLLIYLRLGCFYQWARQRRPIDRTLFPDLTLKKKCSAHFVSPKLKLGTSDTKKAVERDTSRLTSV